MTDDEVAKFFAQWADAGEEVRTAWRKELGATGRAKDWDSVAILLSEQDADVAQEMLDTARWHADAYQRNAAKPRNNTKGEWKRELAAHYRHEVPGGKFKELARQVDGLPIYGQAEEALSLCNGQFEIWRDTDDRIVCVHDDQRHESISRSTFEQNYLRKSPPPE